MLCVVTLLDVTESRPHDIIDPVEITFSLLTYQYVSVHCFKRFDSRSKNNVSANTIYNERGHRHALQEWEMPDL